MGGGKEEGTLEFHLSNINSARVRSFEKVWLRPVGFRVLGLRLGCRVLGSGLEAKHIS